VFISSRGRRSIKAQSRSQGRTLQKERRAKPLKVQRNYKLRKDRNRAQVCTKELIISSKLMRGSDTWHKQSSRSYPCRKRSKAKPLNLKRNPFEEVDEHFEGRRSYSSHRIELPDYIWVIGLRYQKRRVQRKETPKRGAPN
jgi:predicted restriction endonuclease